MNLDQQRLCIELQRLEWADQLDEQVIREIAQAARLTEFQPGQIVFEVDTQIDHVYFVVTGRLEGALFDQLGKEIRRDVFRRGAVAGLFSVLLPERSHLHVEAVEPTIAIYLGLDDLLRLTAKHREFQLAMFRIAANLVKRLMLVDRDLPKPAVVGVAHHSCASRPLTAQLVRRLQQLGESPCLAGDDEQWKANEGVPYRQLFENGVFVGPKRVKEILQEWTAYGRLFIDFAADHSLDDLDRMIAYSDVVLWCLQPEDAPTALEKLKAVGRSAPRLREKVCLVWLLNGEAPIPPFVQELYELAARDFKTCSGKLRPNQGKLLEQGVERIVHYLRGVQIGLALGGGAARGMAHLGVLKSLEQHGIYVDMLAGTSAGAMVGGIYAAGMDPEFSVRCFKHDLLPPWLFRQLPGGGYWYLLYKYRRRQFGPMLRKYLHDYRMEQLTIPTMTISVDLVDGVPLVRDCGDVTQNVLESINLPPLALPIVQAEQAMVDGGLLNNVPANALVAKGCNFVIASTVTASLEKDFMNIRSRQARGASRFISSIQVILRQAMIQSYSMNAVGVQPADFVIAADVTSFDISEFTRADEMAVVGERTTDESVSQLKAMLSKLDPKLFA
ncbi:MAG TPA: cyclic nucleotide-binding and patatin-like phospholipase domain-containing protein [Pirellulales bacterium]|nr:cyclic nucleotide-binding and patatin-like phospholipase domain-containing protein [Pirellulales bacterium]